MKKNFVIFSVFLFVGILFGITSCKNEFLGRQTTVNINLDLSKLIKESRNTTTQENPEYILKIFAYNAENYKTDTEIENLPLLSQATNKVDTNGIVKASLEVPIDFNVIFLAKLYQIVDKTTGKFTSSLRWQKRDYNNKSRR